MTVPWDTQRVTLDVQGLEACDPARSAQVALLMLRVGSLLGHFPTARAHVSLWEDVVEWHLHCQIEMVLPPEEPAP